MSTKFLLREDAGAVDHDVDVAEFGLHLLGHGGDRAFRRHVAFDRDGLPPGGFHHFHGVGGVAEIDDGDVHAVLGQTFGEGLPDAAGGAGDDGDFILVTFGHCCFLLASAARQFPSSPPGLTRGSMMRRFEH